MDDFEIDLFEDIGQDNSDLDIDLIADFDIDDVIDLRKFKDFQYPAMLISNIRFNDTLRILQNLRKESYRLFDVWLDLGSGAQPIKQGTLQADSNILLAMRYLGLQVTIYLDKSNIEVLDLNNPEVIQKFI